MRSLLNFVIRFHFVILFLLFELLSIILVVNYNDYQKAAFLNSSNTIAGKVYNIQYTVNRYFDLRYENQILLAELARYKNNQIGSYKQNKVQLTDIYDSVYLQQYTYITANVVNNSTNRQNNYFTINKGTKQGVYPQMGVITATGVAGIVKDASDNYASVISVLNQNIKISAMLKTSGHFGSLEWNGRDAGYAELTDLPGHLIVKAADTVITSGFSTMFPKGLMIGIVDETDDGQTGEFLRLRVKLNVDFGRLNQVLVVHNFLASEQLLLEQKSLHD